jgi:cell wall-associated NlpC family hydrolase
MINRQQVVIEARKWIKTPFIHQGRRRGLGVDCVGLPLCVIRDLGLGDWSPFYPAYSTTPTGDEVLKACRELVGQDLLYERTAGEVEIGDILVFRVNHSACHAAIMAESSPGRRDRIIHAYSPVGYVVEVQFDKKWRKRFAAGFGIVGVE